MATPHARGSTSACPAVLSRGTGYPACAGIDLPGPAQGDVAGRLPRMRGDRPGQDCRERNRQQATPHARGSTLDGVIQQDGIAGYPASAGIDPTPSG